MERRILSGENDLEIKFIFLSKPGSFLSHLFSDNQIIDEEKNVLIRRKEEKFGSFDQINGKCIFPQILMDDPVIVRAKH